MSSPSHRLRTTQGGCSVGDMETTSTSDAGPRRCMFCGERLNGFIDGVHLPDHSKCTEDRERVAANVREAVSTHWPKITRADLRRLFGITDVRTMNHRWEGRSPYSMSELVILSERLGVRVADLLARDD